MKLNIFFLTALNSLIRGFAVDCITQMDSIFFMAYINMHTCVMQYCYDLNFWWNRNLISLYNIRLVTSQPIQQYCEIGINTGFWGREPLSSIVYGWSVIFGGGTMVLIMRIIIGTPHTVYGIFVLLLCKLLVSWPSRCAYSYKQ